MDELKDLLARVAAILKPEDLVNDAGMAGLLEQVVGILDPTFDPLPQELAEELRDITDPVERFRTAAKKTGSVDSQSLKRLVGQMKTSGLIGTKQ